MTKKDDLIVELAKVAYADAAHPGDPTWEELISSEPKSNWIAAARAMMLHLESVGRLVPNGGRGFTAKSVRDVQTLAGEFDGPLRMNSEFWDARERLQAVLVIRCEYCDDTGDVHSLDGEWQGVCHCVAGDSLRPPAEPAEEETKAKRCPSEIEGWGCSLTNGHDGDHTAYDQDGPAYVWPAASPVVPAPTKAKAGARCREHDLYGRQCMDYAGHTYPHRLVLPTGDTHHWDTPSPAEGVDHGAVEDGMGSEWPRCKADCGIEVVRPGKAQCDCTEPTVEDDPDDISGFMGALKTSRARSSTSAKPAEEEETEPELDMHPDAVYGREYAEQAKARRIDRVVEVAAARKPLETPDQIRRANPGKHQTFIFGQQRADGTACVGCDWQTYEILDTKHAVAEHDDAKGLVHDHSQWIPEKGDCPCGQPVTVPTVNLQDTWKKWSNIPDDTPYHGTTENGLLTETIWVNKSGARHAHRPSGYVNEFGDYADYEMHNFAPFVAAQAICAGCQHHRSDHHPTQDYCTSTDEEVDPLGHEDERVECNCYGWWEPGTECPYEEYTTVRMHTAWETWDEVPNGTHYCERPGTTVFVNRRGVAYIVGDRRPVAKSYLVELGPFIRAESEETP